jgi:stress response protein YsnF
MPIENFNQPFLKEQQMQTVVGVFDSAADARQARDELVRAGFSEDAVTLQSHSDVEDEGFMSSVSHFFKDLFGSDDPATGQYSEAVRRGGSVVAITVDDDSNVPMARTALASAGAVNIERRADEWREEGYQDFDPAAKPYKADQIEDERSRRVLPVMREELEVGKREVDLGTARVFTRTESHPVNEKVELHEQRADIERRQVDRKATDADLKAFDGDSIEVHETTERAVVNKTARVVEEVEVSTQASSHTENITDTVRNTVVEVDRDGDESQARSAGYRTHFDRNLGSDGERYEDYEPAYKYGSSLRSDSRYANRSWDDVEPQARQDWSSRNPGKDSDSAWEKTKSAIKHGWESMTGGSSDDYRDGRTGSMRATTAGTARGGMGAGTRTPR